MKSNLNDFDYSQFTDIPSFLNISDIQYSLNNNSSIDSINNIFPTDSILFCTNNNEKFKETERILGNKVEIIQIDYNMNEIQGTAKEIITDKIIKLYNEHKHPLICEITSLCCESLCDFPGQYIRNCLDVLKSEGLYELIHKYDNHKARAKSLFA